MRRRLLPASLAVIVAAAGGLVASGVTGAAGSQRPAKAAVARSAATSAASSPGAAVTAFGVDLMRQLGRSGNTVFSPFSVATVVAMAGTGASGTTAKQIAHVLHLRSPAQIAGIGKLSSTLAREQSAAAAGATDGPQLDLANGLFLQ
jgi:serine protease inhibitor